MEQPDRVYPYHALAFGLHWQSEVALPLFFPCDPLISQADVTVRLHDTAAPKRKLGKSNASVCPAVDGIRYTAGDVAIIDTYEAKRIEVYPGPDWAGDLPVPFFATVTALMMIRRGCLPLHGSTVDIDGRAVMVCGEAGAGKSTLAAGLIACGARMISDDLTILHPGGGEGALKGYTGRRTMRLFPEIAGFLSNHVSWNAEPFGMEGKLAVQPPCRDAASAARLSFVIVLGNESGSVADEDKPAALRNHFYRPRWMDFLPGRRMRLAAIAMASRHVDVFKFESANVRSPSVFLSRAEEVTRLVHKTTNLVVD